MTSPLHDVLERSKELGLLGPGDVADHIAHARHFVDLLGEEGIAGPLLDLGSGGGLPGLVVAVDLPDERIDLLDASARRCAVLRDAVRRLGVGDRVRVLEGRAEDLAWRDDLRGAYGAVISRSFGPPAVTAECAAGFLRARGHLLVSEPEGDHDRWPEAALAELGLAPTHRVTTDGATAQFLRRLDVELPGVPRATGVPTRRPAF